MSIEGKHISHFKFRCLYLCISIHVYCLSHPTVTILQLKTKKTDPAAALLWNNMILQGIWVGKTLTEVLPWVYRTKYCFFEYTQLWKATITRQFSQHSTSKSAFGIRWCYNKVREPLLHSFVSRWKQCFNPWRWTFNRCRKVVTRLSSEHSCQGDLLPIQAQASEL